MWIARDKNYNDLWIYKEKPIRLAERWAPANPEGNDACYIEEWKGDTMFKDIKWEDEPIEVQFIIKKKED